MARRPKAVAKPSPDKALRDAFAAVEAQPTPEALKDHIDRLTGEPPKRGRPH